MAISPKPTSGPKLLRLASKTQKSRKSGVRKFGKWVGDYASIEVKQILAPCALFSNLSWLALRVSFLDNIFGHVSLPPSVCVLSSPEVALVAFIE
jgi:hypothetical protein